MINYSDVIMGAGGSFILFDGLRRITFGKGCYERLKGVAEAILGGGIIIMAIEMNRQLNIKCLPSVSKILHKYEEKRKEEFGEDILNFDSSDARPHVLYLQSSHDPQKAFEERPGLIALLDKSFDVKYAVVHTWDDICKQIERSKVEIKSLIISAHGDPNAININDGYFSVTDLKKANNQCFSKLASDAEITLASCSTGESSRGFAANLAKITQRVVWSPEGKTAGWTGGRVSAASFHPDSYRPRFRKLTINNPIDVVRASRGMAVHFTIKEERTCLSQPNGEHACGLTEGLKEIASPYFLVRVISSLSRRFLES